MARVQVFVSSLKKMPIIKEKYSHKEKMQSFNPATLEKRKNSKKKCRTGVFLCITRNL